MMQIYRAMLQYHFQWSLILCAFLLLILLILLFFLSLKIRFLEKRRFYLGVLIVACVLWFVPKNIPIIMDWKDCNIVEKEIESYTVEISGHRSTRSLHVIAEVEGEEPKLWLEILSDITEVEELAPGGGRGIIVYAEKSNTFLDYIPLDAVD